MSLVDLPGTLRGLVNHGLVAACTVLVERTCRGTWEYSALPFTCSGLPATTPVSAYNSYAHDDQGDNPGQATEGSTVSFIKCDRCWRLD